MFTGSNRVQALAGLILITLAYVGLNAAGASRNASLPLIYLLVPLAVWYAICWLQIVQEWERRPVMFLGWYLWTLGRGPNFVEPLFFNVRPSVPVNDVVVAVTVPEVQTKNNVGIKLGGMLTYRVDEKKVRDAVVNVQNVAAAIKSRALTTLTDIAAAEELDELLKDRVGFCEKIRKELQKRVSEWGVTVKAFELEAFSINDPSIAESIAKRARAEKEGEAGLIRARAQKDIALALNDAAATLTTEGRWLKGVEVLTELCNSAQNNTIVIPSDLAERVAGLVPPTKAA